MARLSSRARRRLGRAAASRGTRAPGRAADAAYRDRLPGQRAACQRAAARPALPAAASAPDGPSTPPAPGGSRLAPAGHVGLAGLLSVFRSTSPSPTSPRPGSLSARRVCQLRGGDDQPGRWCSALPGAVLGLAFYVFMAAATSPWGGGPGLRSAGPGSFRWRRHGLRALPALHQLFTLNAICLFCTIVHVITFPLFGLIVFSFAAGYGAPRRRRAAERALPRHPGPPAVRRYRLPHDASPVVTSHLVCARFPAVIPGISGGGRFKPESGLPPLAIHNLVAVISAGAHDDPGVAITHQAGRPPVRRGRADGRPRAGIEQ